MNPIESISLAFKAIISNKMRSSLTMLGVVIGVAAVILLVSIGQGVSQYITEQITELGSNLVFVMPGPPSAMQHGGGRLNVNKLRFEHAEFLQKSLSWIPNQSPYMEGAAQTEYGNQKESSIMVSAGERYNDLRKLEISRGRYISASDVGGSRKVVVVGWSIVDKFFHGKDPIGEKLSINGQKFSIIGQLVKKGQMMGMDQDNIVIIPITTAGTAFGLKELTGIMLEAPSADEVPRLEKAVTQQLSKRLSTDDFHTQTQNQILGMFNTIFGTLTLMLGGIAGISLLVGGIGIMNIMLVSVTERTREIGIRKAVGAKRRDILTQFLIEAVALSVFGGIVGILIGGAGALALNSFLPARVTAWSVLIAFSFSAAVGIISGFYPAYKAAGLDPIDALRYE